jgi:hypothetical protein
MSDSSRWEQLASPSLGPVSSDPFPTRIRSEGMSPMQCPKCSGEMEKGVTLDTANNLTGGSAR